MTPEEQAAAIEAAKQKAAEEAARTERTRVAGIRQSFKEYPEHGDLCDECITNGVSLADANAKLLEKLGSNKEPAVPAHRGPEITQDVRDKRIEAASQWLLFRTGHAEKGQRVQLAGDNPFKGMRMVDMARDALEFSGRSVRGMTPTQIVMAAITHSTSDFPNALQNALNKTLLGAFAIAGDTWRAFCAVGDLADFRPHYRHTMGSFSDLQAVNENGEIQNGTLDDTRKETITATTKGRILNLSHQAIVNDDMGVFTGAARALGRAAARAVENDVYALLALGSDMGPTMSDSATLFHANHGNVTSGALTASTLETARKVLKTQKLPNTSSGVNEYIDITMPPIFVGPVALEGTAKNINDAQYDPDTANKLQRPNVVRGLFSDVVDTPRLTGTRRYLFADPTVAPVLEVDFLDGNQQPFLELKNGFEVDGASYKVRHDYGVSAVDYRGAITNAGA